MNKSEAREVKQLEMHRAMGNDHAVAAGLSALIRSAATRRSRDALIQQAKDWGIANHPEFII